MSVGKASAQVAHAAVMAMTYEEESRLQLWRSSVHKTIIVLEARDENHMRNIESYLSERGVLTATVIDEGVNEIDAHTITAMATDILDKDKISTIDTFSTFKLYKDLVKITTEFTR